jgi:hypothetical protein
MFGVCIQCKSCNEQVPQAQLWSVARADFWQEQNYLINIDSAETLTQYTGNDLTLFLVLRQ